MRFVKRHLEEHVSLRQLEVEEGAGNALIGSRVKRYLSEGAAGLGHGMGTLMRRYTQASA